MQHARRCCCCCGQRRRLFRTHNILVVVAILCLLRAAVVLFEALDARSMATATLTTAPSAAGVAAVSPIHEAPGGRVAASPPPRSSVLVPCTAQNATALVRLAQRQAPCIRVLTFYRPASLSRLLDQLNRLQFGTEDGNVELLISIDAPKNPSDTHHRWQWQESIKVARNFTFVHGTKSVHLQTSHVGLVRQWLHAWQPELDSADEREACVILEDDVLPSRLAWIWLQKALDAYRGALGMRVASLAWQRPTLVPARASSRGIGRMPPGDMGEEGRPFLYRLLSTWGFVALRNSWIEFRRWIEKRHVHATPVVTFEGSELLPVIWSKRRKGTMWSIWFMGFMDERNLYTLYAHLPGNKTLCANMREPGLGYKKALGQDFPLADNLHDPSLSSFPPFETLSAYDWDARRVSASSGPAHPQSSVSLRTEPRQPAFVHRQHEPDKEMAICTLATEGALPELELLLWTLRLFQPFSYVYIAADEAVAGRLHNASAQDLLWLPESLVVVPMIDGDVVQALSLGRKVMEAHGLWHRFQMAKVAILKKAFQDGFRSALYLDADSFLLAPLPSMGLDVLGLSPHLCRSDLEQRFGMWNGGSVFVRNTAVLDAWLDVAGRARSTCCKDQTALEELAGLFPHFSLHPGLNFGWYQLIGSYTRERKDQHRHLQCMTTAGDGCRRVYFKGRQVISMHLHLSKYPKISSHLRKVLRECEHPLSGSWWL